MGHLTHDEFFTKLADVFTTRRTKAHGAVFLTQKRLSHNTNQQPTPSDPSSADPLADLHPAQPLPLLVRATNGKGKADRAAKVKLSTVVEPDALEGFYARYAEVCKAGMTALKPRDRTKRKAKAKKRKGGAGAGAGAAAVAAAA
ncbi:signal recognition particle 14kD protein-domain-containing protein [Chaetomium fimeti]|uniref:Signal recognition particle subunit SRP14 n=1 Tax=Chaetomium fimeti TaxID=1854472 RepID=A0AAE0HS89_9PEZI|nr:signal recognition particle 14kD protein-domain-containing protein [Chaetomium fimeti]